MADLLASRRTAPEQDIGLELQSAFAVLRQRLAGESAGETPPVATLEAIARAFDLDRFACDVILLAAIAALMRSLRDLNRGGVICTWRCGVGGC